MDKPYYKMSDTTGSKEVPTGKKIPKQKKNTRSKRRRRVSLARFTDDKTPEVKAQNIIDALNEIATDGFEPNYSRCETVVLRYISFVLRPTGLAIYLVLATTWISALTISNNRIEQNCDYMTNVYVWEPTEVPLGFDSVTYNNLNEYGEVKSYKRLKTVKTYNTSFKPTDCIEDPPEREYYFVLYGVLQSTMIFMMVMTLETGLTKYREEITLYETLTSHIKSLAMFITHLTYDKQKYKYTESGGDETLQYKEDVKDHYAKIRCILAVMAPAARLVLKGDYYDGFFSRPKPYADVKQLETVKRYRKRNSTDRGTDDCNINIWSNKCDISYILCLRFCFPRKYRRVKMPWSKYNTIRKATNNNENWKQYLDNRVPVGQENVYLNYLKAIRPSQLEYTLFQKVEFIQNRTDLDLFDTLSTVLLDEIMVISENSLGFGNDEGSAVMSAVYAKWDAMYSAWGDMTTVKSYNEPNHIHIYRLAMLLGYAILMPFSYVKYIEESDDVLLYICWVSLDISVFLVMWYIAYAIRNPFMDVRCMNGVKYNSAMTQTQVLNLLKFQKDFEIRDYKGGRYGWNYNNGTPINPFPIETKVATLHF